MTDTSDAVDQGDPGKHSSSAANRRSETVQTPESGRSLRWRLFSAATFGGVLGAAAGSFTGGSIFGIWAIVGLSIEALQGSPRDFEWCVGQAMLAGLIGSYYGIVIGAVTGLVVGPCVALVRGSALGGSWGGGLMGTLLGVGSVARAYMVNGNFELILSTWAYSNEVVILEIASRIIATAVAGLLVGFMISRW
jgi:hypothetical protein